MEETFKTFNWEQNSIFLGDRSVLFPEVKKRAPIYFESKNVFEKKEALLFEIEKLNISVDDIRRMISFVNRGSEGQKIILLSSFYWSDEAQNAMLKVLEETPLNTVIYIFGLNEKKFLDTIHSRIQKFKISGTNRYSELAKRILDLEPNSRLENSQVKKILSLKAVDIDFEKNKENEKKDREAHILFLYALIDEYIARVELNKKTKKIYEKILKISELAEIEGGSPHLFIEWFILSV